MPGREDVYWNAFVPILLNRMSDTIRGNITSLVSEHGLTGSHAIYLMALEMRDGQTLVGLSRFLDLDTANTNRVIGKLREKGLITDDRKTESGKKYHISLTKEGHELAGKVMDGVSELNDTYLRGIPGEEVEIMRNVIIRILDNMETDVDGPKPSERGDVFYGTLRTQCNRERRLEKRRV